MFQQGKGQLNRSAWEQPGVVRVLYDYDPQYSQDLRLRTGDLITEVVENSKGWWSGKLNGKVGLFPSNFVERLYKLRITVRALFDYKEKPDDYFEYLAFKAGDIILVDDKHWEGVWWHGRLKLPTGEEAQGWFPSAFVKEMDLRKSATGHKDAPPIIVEKEEPTPDTIAFLSVDVLSASNLKPHQKKRYKISVQLSMGEKKKRKVFKTKEIADLNPVFNEHFQLNVTNPEEEELLVSVLDHKHCIGEVLVKLERRNELEAEGGQKKIHPLTGKHATGTIQLHLTYRDAVAVSQPRQFQKADNSFQALLPSTDADREALEKVLAKAGIDPGLFDVATMRSILGEAVRQFQDQRQTAQMPPPSVPSRPQGGLRLSQKAQRTRSTPNVNVSHNNQVSNDLPPPVPSQPLPTRLYQQQQHVATAAATATTASASQQGEEAPPPLPTTLPPPGRHPPNVSVSTNPVAAVPSTQGQGQRPPPPEGPPPATTPTISVNMFGSGATATATGSRPIPPAGQPPGHGNPPVSPRSRPPPPEGPPPSTTPTISVNMFGSGATATATGSRPPPPAGQPPGYGNPPVSPRNRPPPPEGPPPSATTTQPALLRAPLPPDRTGTIRNLSGLLVGQEGQQQAQPAALPQTTGAPTAPIAPPLPPQTTGAGGQQATSNDFLTALLKQRDVLQKAPEDTDDDPLVLPNLQSEADEQDLAAMIRKVMEARNIYIRSSGIDGDEEEEEWEQESEINF